MPSSFGSFDILMQEFHRQPDISSRILPDLPLDGEKAPVADFIQRGQVFRPVDAALSQRDLGAVIVLVGRPAPGGRT